MNGMPHVEPSARTIGAETDIQVVLYPAFPLPSSKLELGMFPPLGQNPAFQSTPATVGGNTEKPLPESVEERIAEETRKGFEAGRQRGLQDGVQTEREAQREVRHREEKQRGEQLAALVQKFEEERERYLHSVEQEVVNLALAIAARILRREAQMDPLLLTGAVRVALGQLSESTEVRLRVPTTEVDLWEEAIEHIPNLTLKPRVVASDELLCGDCVIETELGSVDLGVRSQLGEIERGFFDRSHRSNSQTLHRNGELKAPGGRV